MSDTPEPVDLAYVGRALRRLTSEVGTLRDDINVLAAIVRGIDNNQDRRLEELRATHRQHDRLANRVKELEERSQT